MGRVTALADSDRLNLANGSHLIPRMKRAVAMGRTAAEKFINHASP